MRAAAPTTATSRAGSEARRRRGVIPVRGPPGDMSDSALGSAARRSVAISPESGAVVCSLSWVLQVLHALAGHQGGDDRRCPSAGVRCVAPCNEWAVVPLVSLEHPPALVRHCDVPARWRKRARACRLSAVLAAAELRPRLRRYRWAAGMRRGVRLGGRDAQQHGGSSRLRP